MNLKEVEALRLILKYIEEAKSSIDDTFPEGVDICDKFATLYDTLLEIEESVASMLEVEVLKHIKLRSK